jgi:hypothetical protein
MSRWFGASVCAMSVLLASRAAWAQGERVNRGGDPFFQISQAVSSCPVPLGPFQTQAEWLAESHYRIERGNSCWWEGRCRLPNGYLYDKEIAESVERRLASIEPVMRWKTNTTLWIMLQRRFIYVQGCVARGFDKQKFLAELAKTADVERVIDETTSHPESSPPYRTRENPTVPAAGDARDDLR